jgi:putative membrane protein
MSEMETGPPDEIDYRFTLANERTFLAWIRTALALVAGGVFAAKGLDFNHEVWRWVIAAPPIIAGAVVAFDARARWRRYENAMLDQRPLPKGRGMTVLGGGLALYALVALVVSVLES